MSSPDFIVHDPEDSVGVAVVETIEAGRTLTGWVMAKDATITLLAKDAIPLGHKIALRNLGNDETVLKYGQDIGRTVAAIEQGRHVHVHNLKTKRW